MQISNNLVQNNKIEKKETDKFCKKSNLEVKTLTNPSQSIINSLRIDVKRSSIPASDLKIVTDNKPQVSTDRLNKKDEPKTALDKNVDIASKVTIGVSTVGSAVTAPGEFIKAAPAIHKLCTNAVAATVIEATISTPNSVKEKVFLSVAKTVGKAAKASTALAGIAVKVNHVPTYNVMTNKVLPVANGVLSGIGVYTGIKKYNEASKKGNKIEMVKSGTQVALNVVSGVGGFVPGKGQVISGVAGIASLVSDFAIDKTSKLFIKKQNK